MAGIYVSVGVSSGTVTSSNNVTNDSGVSGATVTDALNTLNTGVITKYIPSAPITLTNLDIINRFIVLPTAPTDPTKTQLTVINGILADYGTDFVVLPDLGGRKLSWNGLNLFNDLVAGDQIVVVYN